METELDYRQMYIARNDMSRNETLITDELLSEILETYTVSDNIDTSIYYELCDQVVGYTTSDWSTEYMNNGYINVTASNKDHSDFLDARVRYINERYISEKVDNLPLSKSDELDEHLKQFSVRR